MAEFVYFTGPMDSGKSTLALQLDYTQTAGGRRGRLFTSQDRAGEATISSRLGLARAAVEVDSKFDLWTFVVDHLTAGERIDYLVCDEAQFYSAQQIDQLARVVDERPGRGRRHPGARGSAVGDRVRGALPSTSPASPHSGGGPGHAARPAAVRASGGPGR